MRLVLTSLAVVFSLLLVAPALSQNSIETPSAPVTWILPSVARFVYGAGRSVWMTNIVVTNPTAQDETVIFKFLDHDADGTAGPETTWVISAGKVLDLGMALLTLFDLPEGYGAVYVRASSGALVIQSETWSPAPDATIGLEGGIFGQTIPALSPADFAGSTPKTLVPIRESSEFRTNLVMANAAAIPVTAHVALYDEDGRLLGSRDVDLPPLGMTQISHVATALSASPPAGSGRLAVSTSTSGGLVAAYASVIDNFTNDPRTVLPR